jgi:hypothetical protein
MSRKFALPNWMGSENLHPALWAGLFLFLASYVADFVLATLGKQGSSTSLNDAAIGLLGSLLLLFYLTTKNERQNLARAKERIALVAKLNHSIREALFEIGKSAMLEDREERLRVVDRAMNQVDNVLLELVPAVSSTGSPRLTVPGWK